MTRTIEALKVIRDSRPKSFRQFAELFWPKSNMHTKVTRCGNGARRGAGAFLCAGSFLSKLQKDGLIVINRHNDTSFPIAGLTAKGRKLLKGTKNDIRRT